jgi:RNA polymerase sigma-70 factor (ECF subfamily)
MNIFNSKRKKFEALALPFGADLFRLALWRLGNKQDAEDVVQDAYLRAYRSFHTFQSGTNAKAWLVKILLNAVTDALKKRVRQPNTVDIDDELVELETAQLAEAKEQDPAVQLSQHEIDPDLMYALRRLPTALLHPLLLRELEDMTYEDIATTLGVPIGTVMSRLFRARKLVRERLSKPASAKIVNEVPENEM